MYTKKILLSFLFLASSFIAHSQASETPIKYISNYLDKGTWLIGGNLSYLNTSGADIFYGSLSGAKMISKNVALGANILYVGSGSNTILGPQARYYFNNERSSKFFLLGNVNFKTEGGSPNYSVGAGLANFLSDYVSIDITGNYGNSISSSRSNLISLLAGLQIYLPKKK